MVLRKGVSNSKLFYMEQGSFYFRKNLFMEPSCSYNIIKDLLYLKGWRRIRSEWETENNNNCDGQYLWLRKRWSGRKVFLLKTFFLKGGGIS